MISTHFESTETGFGFRVSDEIFRSKETAIDIGNTMAMEELSKIIKSSEVPNIKDYLLYGTHQFDTAWDEVISEHVASGWMLRNSHGKDVAMIVSLVPEINDGKFEGVRIKTRLW